MLEGRYEAMESVYGRLGFSVAKWGFKVQGFPKARWCRCRLCEAHVLAGTVELREHVEERCVVRHPDSVLIGGDV